MSADSDKPSVPPPRDELAAQLHQLEEFVTRAESQGEQLPPEAVEMIARLRDIMQALDGLAASFGDAQSHPATADSQREPT